MDEDRTKSVKDQAAGSIKEAVGKVIGDRKTEDEGKAQKIKGKAESKIRRGLRNTSEK